MSSESKTARSQEKNQVKWGIETFTRFLDFAEKRGGLPAPQVNTLKSELKELEQAAMGEDQPEAIAEQLNHYISMVNSGIKEHAVDIQKYAPFPEFSFATGVHLQSAVLDQLDMIERTLTEAAHSGVMQWDTESHFFSDILQIFSEVENKKMLPQEGMAKLVGELNKINENLTDEWKFPIPDLSAYEF